jgi:hypothetical protein
MICLSFFEYRLSTSSSGAAYMDQMPPPAPPTISRPRVPALLWRLALACLLGTLALVPLDLPAFLPGAPAFFDTFIAWYGPHGLVVTSWNILLVEMLCILLVIAAVSLERRLHSRARVRAIALIGALLLMLGVIANNQKLLNIVVSAAFNRGLGGIPIPFDALPFFFVALAATFLVGTLVQEYARWRQALFFILAGLLCAGVGLLLHLFALSALANQQAETGVLIYDLLILLPLVLTLGAIGGLLGGALRLGIIRYFSTSAEANRFSSKAPPASSAARMWALIWRLLVAGAVGALPASQGNVALWFSLNQQAMPAIIFTPATPSIVWITALLPTLLIAGGMLLGQEARQNGSATERIGVGLLFAVLILGAADLLITLYITGSTLRKPSPSTAILLLGFAAGSLWAILPRSLLTALALDSAPFYGRFARRALPVLLGSAVFLGSLPGTIHNLQTFLEPFQVHRTGLLTAFLLFFILAGLVSAGICGLLGAWLRGKALAAAARLSRPPLRSSTER